MERAFRQRLTPALNEELYHGDHLHEIRPKTIQGVTSGRDFRLGDIDAKYRGLVASARTPQALPKARNRKGSVDLTDARDPANVDP